MDLSFIVLIILSLAEHCHGKSLRQLPGHPNERMWELADQWYHLYQRNQGYLRRSFLSHHCTTGDAMMYEDYIMNLSQLAGYRRAYMNRHEVGEEERVIAERNYVYYSSDIQDLKEKISHLQNEIGGDTPLVYDDLLRQSRLEWGDNDEEGPERECYEAFCGILEYIYYGEC
jgi:hypothetical protein